MAARICAPCGFLGDFLFPEDRPSPIFTTFSIIINGVFLVWSIVSIARGPCDNDPLLWTILGLVSSVINIVFAIYLYARFTYKVRHESTSARHAACHLFLYDWGVCLYLLFSVWLIVWLVFAGITHNDHSNDDDDDNSNNNSERDECAHFLKIGIILFAIYIGLGAFLICCSICTEFCRTPRWRREQERGTYPPTYAQPVATPQGAETRRHCGIVDRIGDIFGGRGHSAQPTVATHPYNQPAQTNVVRHGPPAQNPNYYA